MDKPRAQSRGPHHHKKRKKAARSFLVRRKHSEGPKHQENSDANCHASVRLPQQWQHQAAGSTNNYFKVQACGEMCRITASITFMQDSSWHIHYLDREIRKNVPVLSLFHEHIISPGEVVQLIETVDTFSLCPGNPDERFVDFVRERRGGEVKGDRGTGPVVAYIDNTPVTDTQGKRYICTVRRTDCDIVGQF